jgi:hypothetical protein
MDASFLLNHFLIVGGDRVLNTLQYFNRADMKEFTMFNSYTIPAIDVFGSTKGVEFFTAKK